MEAVKAFDIHIDLDNCEKLYDYGRFEFISRPAGGWDLPTLVEEHRQERQMEDESSLSVVKKMDLAHTDKGHFEKDASKKKEDDTVNFDNFSGFDDKKPALPMRVFPMFAPGDIIKGYVYLELNENLEAERVNINFKGHASTCVMIYTGQTACPVYGEEVYVDEKEVAWMKSGSQDSSVVSLTKASIPTGNTLAAGVHRFPFTYQIPTDARQTVPNLHDSFWNSEWAFISYFIKATIEKGKTLRRGNIVTHKGIFVERVYDIASNAGDLQPICEEKVQTTGVFTKGSVTCRAEIPGRAYTRLDSIPLILEINNESGGDINSVKARVLLTGRFRAGDSKCSPRKSIKVRGEKAEEGPIANGEHPRLSLIVPLEFRESAVDGNLIPAGTLNNCQIIEVEYNLVITLKRKGLHRDVEMSIPITVGTHDSREEKI